MRYFFLLFSLFVTFKSHAKNYYFSTSTGLDARSPAEAQKPETPWKSLEKLNAFFPNLTAGDVIYLKRGDVFNGSINILQSGSSSSPITFSAYGSGNKPIISGFSTPSGWSTQHNNIWEATANSLGSSVNMLLINGVAKRVGRYPNYVSASDQGYLYYEGSNNNTSITDNKINGTDFTGGEVVIRKNRWVVDKNEITRHLGNIINYKSQSGYWPDKGNGYFIQNHPKTLDREGEWFYKPDEKKIGIFTNDGLAALQNVQISTVEVLVLVTNQSNLVFDNIVFKGANTQAFSIKYSKNIKLSNCEILYSGGNAITATDVDFLTIENSAIAYTNNIALNATSCSNTNFKNNKIKCTGIFAGMGDGDSGSYEAILISGDNNNIEKNEIDSTGYIPITFSGNNVSVSNNYISNYAFVKDDGGGIYTWNNGPNAPKNSGRKIVGNILTNGIGASDGTADKTNKFAHGIYIDDNATNVEIVSNTVAECQGFGIYIHNARDILIKSNTIYNNQVQLEMQHDDIASNSPISNCTVTDNILFSLHANQPVAEFKTKNDDLANFGNFNYNYYCRPIEDNAVISTLKKVDGNYIFNQVDIDGWKAMYGKDANSSKTSQQIASYSISNFKGSNKFGNGAFTSNVGGLYGYSPENNFTTQWNNSALDGGTLHLAFAGSSGKNNKGTVIINVGAVKANQPYILRFSLKGGMIIK